MNNETKEIAKLSEEETFCLDAYLINGNKELAYRLSRDRKLSGTPESVYQCQQRWMRSAPVVAYIEKGKRENLNNASHSAENGEMPEIRDRDMLLRELNQLATATNDTKTRADILCRIADLQQMKKEQTETEQQVKYYLPLPENEFVDYIKNRFKQDKAFASEITKLINL